jgi:hypothetical protein
VSLQLVPVGWFVSIRSSGVLSTGIYEGEDNRLVSKRTVPFAELAPEFLRREVADVITKQVVRDCQALRESFGGLGGGKRF